MSMNSRKLYAGAVGGLLAAVLLIAGNEMCIRDSGYAEEEEYTDEYEDSYAEEEEYTDEYEDSYAEEDEYADEYEDGYAEEEEYTCLLYTSPGQ